MTMSMLMRKPILAILGLIAMLVVGCGGGGSGGSGGDGGGGSVAPTYTLSGTITAAAGSLVDSDVNDLNAPYQFNGTADLAQFISNPVILGGHANIRGTGPAGRTRNLGDQQDWYSVLLSAGQTITLYIAEEDSRANDLDLYLYNTSGGEPDASLGQERFEVLTVPRTGQYLVLVEAFSGSSNYILSIGQQTVPAVRPPRLSDAFAPGEVVVRFTDASAASERGPAARAQATGLVVKGGAEGRNMLLTLEGVERETALRTLGITSPPASQPALTNPQTRLKYDTLLAVKALRRRADVVVAEPNYLRQPLLVPNDELYRLQWHYPMINLPAAWDLQTGGDIIVAVIDTGVVLSHPDFQGQLVAGYDFISNPARSVDGDGIDPNPDDPGDQEPGGSSFHGTHVSGTVAAATNNAIGVAGVAFGAKVMPLRVLGKGGGTSHDVEQAVRYAAGLPNDSGRVPDRRADVINLSLGGGAFSATEQDTYTRVRNAGVVVVAAAGNKSTTFPSYPAAYPGVISVSAVDINKELAFYSNFGSLIDVAAPGGDTRFDINGDGFTDGVLSTGASDAEGSIVPKYLHFQGTSMASPHVAGVIALMRAANSNLTPQDIDNLLTSGVLTEDLGAPGRDDLYGHGLINAYQAVVQAMNTTGGTPVTPVPILTADPAALNFGLTRTQMTLTLSNGGIGQLQVNQSSQTPPESSSWLTVPAPVDDGLGSYTLTVDRTGLAPNIYTAIVTFTSNANTVEVPVIMEVGGTSGTADLGVHYVIAVDSTTKQTVQKVVATRQSDGNYRYQLSGVPAGKVELHATSDFDNDGLLCDAGEACGAYLTVDGPVDIEVNGDQSGLDFPTSYTAKLADIQAAAKGAPEPEGFSLLVGDNRRLDQ